MATYWENSCSFGLRYVSWYKYLIVGLVFSHLGFWSGNLFLIAPFPDLCLLVPFDDHKVNDNDKSHFPVFQNCWTQHVNVYFTQTCNIAIKLHKVRRKNSIIMAALYVFLLERKTVFVYFFQTFDSKLVNKVRPRPIRPISTETVRIFQNKHKM